MLFILAHVAALLVGAALERAWPQALRIGNVGPDVVLVLVACAGITRGRVAGYAAGLFGGFLLGAAGEGGYSALIIGLMLVGFLAGQVRGTVFADHILVAPVVALLATLVASVVQLVVSPPPQFLPWLGEVGRLLLYNAVVSPLAYVFARALARRWPLHAET